MKNSKNLDGLFLWIWFASGITCGFFDSKWKNGPGPPGIVAQMRFHFREMLTHNKRPAAILLIKLPNSVQQTKLRPVSVFYIFFGKGAVRIPIGD